MSRHARNGNTPRDGQTRRLRRRVLARKRERERFIDAHRHGRRSHYRSKAVDEYAAFRLERDQEAW